MNVSFYVGHPTSCARNFEKLQRYIYSVQIYCHIRILSVMLVVQPCDGSSDCMKLMYNTCMYSDVFARETFSLIPRPGCLCWQTANFSYVLVIA